MTPWTRFGPRGFLEALLLSTWGIALMLVGAAVGVQLLSLLRAVFRR